MPSISDSTLAQVEMPSTSDDLAPSVSDSALAHVEMSSVPDDLAPSVLDSTLARVKMPSASDNPAPSVYDSGLAQVEMPPCSDAPALDLTPPPDENEDDDGMGDSADFPDNQQLAVVWKRVPRTKGQRSKNLARKAPSVMSRLFPPGVTSLG